MSYLITPGDYGKRMQDCAGAVAKKNDASSSSFVDKLANVMLALRRVLHLCLCILSGPIHAMPRDLETLEEVRVATVT